MSEHSILLVNDVTGYGRVSSFAMVPILAAYGLHPYLLPTGLVSNTLDYGRSEILDTTEFMRNAIKVWDDLGFGFDNIATGFINSDEQVDIICDLIDKQESPYVIVDPIMAENGVLYDNMYEGSIECNRRLASKADVIIPNMTEATMLADIYIGRESLSTDEFKVLVDRLHALGASKVVITSCKHDDGTSFNLVSESGRADDMVMLPYDSLDYSFIGTGDMFSGVLVSELISGSKLRDAVETASGFVRQVMIDNRDAKDPFDIHFEGTLGRFIRDRLPL